MQTFRPNKRARRGLSVAAGAAFSVAALTAPAAAQNLEYFTTSLTDTLQSVIDILPQGVNNVGLGLGPGLYPQFEGSRVYDVHVVPVLSFRYGDWLEVVNNEIHITAFSRLFSDGVDNKTARRRRFRRQLALAGPLISINFGRSESDSPDLHGLGDVGISFELGAFVSYTIDGMRFRLRARQDVADGHKGATVQADISKTFFHGPRVSLSGFVAAEGASAAYMKSFFGVTGTQSINSGLPVYHAGAGAEGRLDRPQRQLQAVGHLNLFANVGYERLLGGAADSPLVQLRGWANQATLSSFIVYSF